jgi:hypothetical protein
MPASLMTVESPIEHRLLHFELRDAVAQQPANGVAALVDATAWPALLSCAAAASPAGPDPTTATRLPALDT